MSYRMNVNPLSFMYRSSSCGRISPQDTVPQEAARATYTLPGTLTTSEPTHENLFERLMAAIETILATHHQATLARVEQLEMAIHSLTNEVASAREEAQINSRNVVQYLKAAHSVHKAAADALTDRVHRLETVIGTSCNEDEGESLLERLDNISFIVEDLLQKGKDPPQEITQHQVGASSAIEAEQPKRQPTNADIHSRTPEYTLMPQQHFVKASLETVEETPSLVRPTNSNRQSSISLTDQSNNKESQPDSTSPSFHQKAHADNSLRSRFCSDLHSRLDIHVQPGVIPVKAYFSSVPSVSDPLSPARWTNEDAPSSASSSADASNNEDETLAAVFLPDTSPRVTNSYMLMGNPGDKSPDGTISSLRRTALWESRLGQSDGVSPASVPPSQLFSPVLSKTSLSLSRSDSKIPTSTRPIKNDLITPSSPCSDFVRQEETLVEDLIMQPVSSLAGTPSPTRPTKISPISLPSVATPPKPSVPQILTLSAESPALSPLSSITDDNESSKSITRDVDALPQPRPLLRSQRSTDLKLKIKVPAGRRQSSGATRIKKRKILKEDPSLPEPPLKRARRKLKRDGPQLGKRRKSAPVADQAKWPRMLKYDEDDAFLRKFVQCDGCLLWYHYGCVGIVPGDVRLEETEIFTCPPCFSDAKRFRVKAARGSGNTCSRPDCTCDATNEYFVSGIVGRMNGMAGNYVWLVKWDGYPITEATWEDESVMSDPLQIIEAFYKRVEEEGLEYDDNSVILLEEAVEGGWSTDLFNS